MSALRAPMAVPVEVRAQLGSGAEERRAFRLSAAVGEDGVRLFRAAPFEIGRPVNIRFALPAGPSLALRAEVLPVQDERDDEDEHQGAAGRELAFIEPPSDARAAINAYVRARLSLPE